MPFLSQAFNLAAAALRKWLARLEGTIYWPHYEWQINSKPIEIKEVIAATISSYQQLLGVPVNKDFDKEGKLLSKPPD